MATFSTFQLDSRLNQLLEEIGFTTPTPIQEAAIPLVLQGKDVLACAQTGTGKTAAFTLPLLHKLCDAEFRGQGGPQALVLVPTRELAIQVAEETKKFSRNLPKVKTVCIYGGVPYPIQKKALASKYEILVATPGRLIDHMQQGRINLHNIKMLVLDEADRMLDMGFLEAVEEIAKALPAERQTLLFSATIDRKVLPISRQLQKNPEEIRMQQSLERQNAIEQKLYFADNIGHKMQLLEHIIENTEINQSIIFTATIRQTLELAELLQEKGYETEALNGDMNQRQRTRTIEKLRQGKIQFLIATDVAARGIDISTISHVFNFDLPFVAEDFIHRIGRTARAGAKGSAITFASQKEKFRLTAISKVLGKQIEAHTIPGLEPKIQDRKPSFAKHRKPFAPRNPGFSGERKEKKSFSPPWQKSKGFANSPRREKEDFFPRKEARNEFKPRGFAKKKSFSSKF